MASQTGTATDTFPSVYIATAGYDHTIRLWEALNGVCYRTIQHPDSVSGVCSCMDVWFFV